MHESTHTEMRQHPPEPPTGRERLKWYGPGFLWMISAAASGELLFTPRVGSRYEYAFLWAAIVVIFFTWVMITEIGRYTVVTGKTILDGYHDLPGPRNWAIWLIFVPQLVAGAVTVSGIAALLGSAMMIAVPGSQTLYAVVFTLASLALVVAGRYHGVELATTLMAGILVGTAVISAIRVFPSPGTLTSALVPSAPENLDFYFVLPWIGFLLSGAAGVMWYSYWVAAREYGGPLLREAGETQENEPEAESAVEGQDGRERDESLSENERVERLQAWLRTMNTTAAIGVTGGGIIIIAFLILGAELLAPEGLVPSGIGVAEDLTRLLSDVWGQFGYWLLIVGLVVALWGTIIANHDGWGRMFADATLILLPQRGICDWDAADQPEGKNADRTSRRGPSWLKSLLQDRERLKNAYAVVLLTIVPLTIVFLVRNPVDLLSIGGIVAAAHTPVVVFLTLYLNKRRLPAELQPGWFVTWSMVAAGLFFLAFAGLYFLDLVGISQGLSGGTATPEAATP